MKVFFFSKMNTCILKCFVVPLPKTGSFKRIESFQGLCSLFNYNELGLLKHEVEFILNYIYVVVFFFLQETGLQGTLVKCLT